MRTAIFEAQSPHSVCLLLQGHNEFIEKYFEVIGDLNGRGYTVATFDWRGQGGNDRPLDDPLKTHVRDFSEYDEDLKSVVQHFAEKLKGVAPIALAHSLGAHMLLRRLHQYPNEFVSAVLCAPMMEVLARGIPSWMAYIAAKLFCLVGLSEWFALGYAGRDPLRLSFSRQRVTSDRGRFEAAQRVLRANPSLRLGGPTWGWVKAACESMSLVTDRRFAERISTPILICAAGNDKIVSSSAAHRFAQQLPNGIFVVIDRAKHEIMMENDEVRGLFWGFFDEFTSSNWPKAA